MNQINPSSIAFLVLPMVVQQQHLTGTTASIYTMTENGNYSVVVSNGNCTDTSAVYTAGNVTTIDEWEGLAAQIIVYPNPAKNKMYFNSPKPINVAVTSIEGNELLFVKNASMINLGQFSNGIYLLRISDKTRHLIKLEKLVKQQE